MVGNEGILIRVFVGYDRRQDIAYQVCRFSILKHSPTSQVYPIVQDSLRASRFFVRAADPLASTDFATTRYLTPLMAGYDCLALYVDSDIIFTHDVDTVLSDLGSFSNAVWVVQHDYTPKPGLKMDGRQQILYPRKGWMSVAFFNCYHADVRKLTPEVINTAPIPYLNEMQWTKAIGSLPQKWNHLIGEVPKPKYLPYVLHWTRGGPWEESHEPGDYDDIWEEYRREYEQWR